MDRYEGLHIDGNGERAPAYVRYWTEQTPVARLHAGTSRVPRAPPDDDAGSQEKISR
ncbi:hypothetical protein [Actinoplanes sp. NPDC051859]|uniref:hypothetical protein n=1 Tax=Actinoplanes sp. NPDC051859 TaxID=3363909 RepID=UPI0037B67072